MDKVKLPFDHYVPLFVQNVGGKVLKLPSSLR